MSETAAGLSSETASAPSSSGLPQRLRASVERAIIGQLTLTEHLLTGFIAGGHMLIEGMPGLAKTTAVKAIADAIDADFKRIQFTPDLLPSDITGTDIFVSETGNFVFREGPLFNHIILADEINRAPAKVQAALLEAMEEKQITVGVNSYRLPELFTVLATQNPIEQEGTYALPEAQLDRFMLHIHITYPTAQEERLIADLADSDGGRPEKTPPVAAPEDLLHAKREAASLFLHDRIKDYIVNLVCATRRPEAYGDALSGKFAYGASPRATLALIKCARALAYIRGDAFVTPEHVQYIAPAVLRHRIGVSFAAEAEGFTRDDAVQTLLSLVAAP